MCGIFGFAKREGWQSESQMDRIDDVISNLTFESVVRGNHSTGFAIASKTDKLVYKTLKPSDELVCSDEWHNVIDKVDVNTTVFLGHVRFATTGAKVKENAHPFVMGSVIGAHNGIIYNHEEIASKIGKNVQVDSEVIFGLLNKKNKYQEVFDLIEGDYALSWIDDDYKVLKLMHEEGRPLHIAYWKKARCLFWASTAEILETAFKEAGLSIEDSINTLPVDKVYEFDTSNFWSKHDAKFTEVKTNVNSSWSNYGSYGSSYGGYGGSNYFSSASAYYCKFCQSTTYKADRICYKCVGKTTDTLNMNTDGNWTAECLECFNVENYDNLVYTGSGYLCIPCNTQNSKYVSSFTSQCDYCGDYEPAPDLYSHEGYKLCQSCYDADKKTSKKSNLPVPTHGGFGI
jgi:predicted glutamine amidotransferase|tara:strand:- start:24 stop:1226 length:1203 start_codon:yes stop_codon:yes gene_type:complete